MKNKILNENFYNYTRPSVYGTVNKLKESLKPLEKKYISRKKIKNWLLYQDVNTLHKPATYKFNRNHYSVSKIDELWEIDLCDMSMYASENDGYKFILSVIDVFSKYGWMIPVKSKSANEITKTFRNLINDSGRHPETVQSDAGKEFKNKIFQSYLHAQSIKQNFPIIASMQKAAVVERFNRTMKEKMFKYFTSVDDKNKRYIDVLPDLVKSYNNSVHSTIKMKPVDVESKHTVQIYNNIRNKFMNEKKSLAKFVEGDFVRMVRRKSQFEHGYTEKWTREIFQIQKVIMKKPHPLYMLIDLNGKSIHGKFYAEELQKIKLRDNYPIKTIKTRGIGSNVQYLVELHNKKKIWITKEEYLRRRRFSKK